jgi:hypothetical protein
MQNYRIGIKKVQGAFVPITLAFLVFAGALALVIQLGIPPRVKTFNNLLQRMKN